MEATEYTYEDAGRLCGVSAETIRQRARRGKLRRGRPTNTGRPTVLLTEQDIAAIAAGRPFIVQANGQPDVQPDVQPSGHAGWPDGQPTGEAPANPIAIRAHEGEAAALRDALDRERGRVDQQRVEVVELRGQVERQGRELTAALLRTAIAEAEARGLRELHEALELARRPAWRRLLGRPGRLPRPWHLGTLG